METPFDFAISRFHDVPGFQSSLRHFVTSSPRHCVMLFLPPMDADDRRHI
jgi:hypothetical protein